MTTPVFGWRDALRAWTAIRASLAVHRGRARTLTTAFAMVALLAGCVTVPSTRGDGRILACDVGSTDAACVARIAAHGALPADAGASWQFQGRAALSGRGQGGNARIEWEHAPSQDVVVLSAPVTRQSWRLEASPTSATLHGMAGGPRSDGDAQDLLREATGWEIPVGLLGHWVLGRAAPTVPVSQYRFPLAGDEGLLAGFDQAGWRIDITGRDAQGRPLRLNAEQPAQGHRVRLVIDHWGAPAP
ncbi:MAG: outer membrane lipoprotein LolB [Pseudoxanthomonas suwonensis]|nr:outer membrane lipoprotein LolB [Pseudoxanthomonas suwonensis]